MTNKCPSCRLVNYPDTSICARCGAEFCEIAATKVASSPVLRRAAICFLVCLLAFGGFYISLVFSADPMSVEQRELISRSIHLLNEKGFSDEVFVLKRLAVYRVNDNWLNASVVKENAFAATNFPFEIVTLYPDFFAYPTDDTERAAILLHEARHLMGAGENDAYEFVWRNRKQLGWTGDRYVHSTVWAENMKQTREYVPRLFKCGTEQEDDCTED